MNAMTTFDFQEQAVRVVTRDDGEPWFVGKDVCACLEIKNHKDALARLDEDERAGVGITDLRSSNGVSQARSMIVISEAGCYRLIFTSRTPAAEAFKRWLAHEVLPTLRRTGTYDMTAAGDSVLAETWQQFSPYEVRTQTLLVKEFRLTYGPAVARAMWHTMKALPQVPPSLYPGPAALLAADRAGCLGHLLAATVPDGGTVGAMIGLARTRHGARQMLSSRGVLVNPRGKPGYVAIATAHPWLDEVFARSDWPAEWVAHLMDLPGALRPKNAVLFADKQRRAVLVPLALCVGGDDGAV